MNRSYIFCVAGIAIAGITACLIVQHRLAARLNERERLRHVQEEQLSALTREHERLANRVPVAEPESRALELTRLRQEADRLKAQTNILAQELKQAAEPNSAENPPPARTPEFYEELRKLAGKKPSEALHLASAFAAYAADHDSQSPANLDELNAYMAAQGNPRLSGNTQFEIVYHGTLDQLKGIPFDTVAVIREKNHWLGPDGAKFKIYGMANGSSEMVESNDDFKSWEAKHIISP